MIKFSWYTIPKRMTKLITVYQYAVDRFLPVSVDKNGFGRYIHFKQGVFVDDEDGGWNRYKPNMKGGHRHNHIYNVCHRITFRSKSARHRVSREDKMRFVATFYVSLMLHPQTLGDILKRRK